MATATICSTFDITILAPIGITGVATSTFTATRAFTVVGITAQNDAGAESAVTIAAGGGAAMTGTTATPPVAGAGVVQAQSAAAGIVADVAVVAANASVAKGAAVAVSVAHVTVTKVVLHCIGNPSQAVTIVTA